MSESLHVIIARRTHFLRQLHVHERAGEAAVSKWVIGDELGFTREQTDATVRTLEALGWVLAATRESEMVRLTATGWERLDDENRQTP